MENQNQKNNPKKHLIISLSIIGAALVVAIIIAVIAIVGKLKNTIDGKNPEELYASISSSVYSTDNYQMTFKKVGKGILIGNEVDIELEEDIRVDGEDFYHKVTRTVKRTSGGKQEVINKTVRETTIIDGISYISITNGDKPAQKTKYEVGKEINSNRSEELMQSIVWKYEDLFENCDLKQTDGLYRVEMNKENASDLQFAKALTENAYSFFEDNGVEYLVESAPPKDFENYEYVIVYNSDGRPVSIDYKYDMGHGEFFDGNLKVEADFEYGTVKVEAPTDAESYQ